MLMVRIRIYDGSGSLVGEMEFSAASVQVWLSRIGNQKSDQLQGIRDLVDPDHENKNYDWDIWAKPVEVAEDLRGDGKGPELLQL